MIAASPLDQPKKALAERALNVEMDHHPASGEPGAGLNEVMTRK